MTTTKALNLNLPENQPIIAFTREFDHPAAAVFAAHADPKLYAEWLGPRELTTDLHTFDFRTGGSWAYTSTDPDGNDYSFRGSFHSVTENEEVVQTFEFLGFPGVVSIETLTFEDLGDGRCRLSGTSVWPSLEARNGMAQSDMETGMSQGYERLEELLD